MTLADNEMLQRKLSQWQPVGDGRHSFSESLEDSGWNLQISADHNDRIGCLVWELSLTRENSSEASPDLRTWAKAIAGRVRGLREDLKLIEVDGTRNQAILRSEDPSAKGDSVQYYEISLTGSDSAAVRRFQANRKLGSPREQIAFALTHETLASLVCDIAG